MNSPRCAHDLYFCRARLDALELLPDSINRVLEVGCGGGATLAAIRQRYPQAWLGGAEIFPDAADEARRVADEVFCVDIEADVLPIPPASLDVVLCLDVLEHLRDPWTVVARLHRLLKPGGVLIASLPNVRHISVWWPLVFGGRWRYTEEGILDRTHLRFFTRETAAELVGTSGLRVDRVVGTGTGIRGRLFRRTGLLWGTGWFAWNFLVRGVNLAPHSARNV